MNKRKDQLDMFGAPADDAAAPLTAAEPPGEAAEAVAVVEAAPVASSGGGTDGIPPVPPIPTDGDSVPLSLFAERAYLDYAMSVLKGRALPDLSDGQKPVQRRILFTMREAGLGPGAKPTKSARVVGDVMGKYHPHGDASVYDAMVRLAQDFSLRYPLVDGQGNFGSRDGDSAAAMRYTEARLTAFANHVLLSELDQGTVEFVANYDGAFQEPALLPARLPVLLLNGASGIAVGMATEVPPHNLAEVAQAAIALIRKPRLTVAELMAFMPGPDYPGAGQIISPRQDIQAAYETGRGSLKVRARWTREEMARGQWQIVISELPPGTSTQGIMQEIEDISNPKVRPGKKSVTQEQGQQKQLLLSLIDRVRDESGKDHPVRLVIEPKTSRIDTGEMMNVLLTLTSLETSVGMNLVAIGRDGRPRQKTLVDLLQEWVGFRFDTVRRRTAHRLDRVLDRIHVLEGRMVVFLNIDEVIRIIRESDEPKSALMQRFSLSERQADDILEIRLRQLARLEAIRIEQELTTLRQEEGELRTLLADEQAMQRLVIKEVQADAKQFGDARRTLIEESRRAAVAVPIVDEPVTLIVSRKGWLRTRNGHGLDLAAVAFKDGDALLSAFECRTTDNAIALSSDGRAYTIAVAQVPGGKGEGVPTASLVELQPGARIVHVLCAPPERSVLLATSSGYGFTCRIGDMASRNRSGKQFMAPDPGDDVLAPALFEDGGDLLVAALSSGGRLHSFPLEEMRLLSGGGKGVIIVALDEAEKLLAAVVAGAAGVVVTGSGRGGKPTELPLSRAALTAEYLGRRARKGRAVPKLKVTGLRVA